MSSANIQVWVGTDSIMNYYKNYFSNMLQS